MTSRITVDAVRRHEAEMLREIQELVEFESPSSDKRAVDRLGELLARRFQAMGAHVHLHNAQNFGNHLQADFPGQARKPVLLLGHIDTVWDLGTLAKMPFRIADDRVCGPGVLDMKAGIVMAIYAIQLLRSNGELPRPVRLLLNTDEEVGSESSRAITETVARSCEAVFVLEPAQGLEGSLKTARKGVGDYYLKVTGKAAHAGVDFGSGVNAIRELARQIERVSEFTDLSRGLTVNVGVVKGGTRGNVVPAEAEAEVDVRVQRMADAEELDRKFQSLTVTDPRCKLKVSGGVNRPPMERTEKIGALFEKARAYAAEHGFALDEKGTGGGSDGNFTAALGIPTLDGLGAVGEGAHALHESILLEHLAP
ncbi:MAG TPA: M20 family metallopeptidase, partial [Terriglobales bacterium]